MTDIKQLVTGFKRFRNSYFGKDQQLFGELKRGQSPTTLVIACSDSRVDPAIITDCEPGDLFVVRNVANLVPPYEKGSGLHGVSTALEFAVCTLKVENIIVLGHSQCGGIHALMNGTTGEFVPGWMNISKRAKERVLAELPDATPAAQVSACEEESILVSLENLLTFPWLKARVDSGDLTLHGWYFDIGTGELVGYNSERDVFENLA